jgi:hypothetical protein
MLVLLYVFRFPGPSAVNIHLYSRNVKPALFCKKTSHPNYCLIKFRFQRKSLQRFFYSDVYIIYGSFNQAY